MLKVWCIARILLVNAILLAACALFCRLAFLAVLDSRQRREAAFVHASARLCISTASLLDVAMIVEDTSRAVDINLRLMGCRADIHQRIQRTRRRHAMPEVHLLCLYVESRRHHKAA